MHQAVKKDKFLTFFQSHDGEDGKDLTYTGEENRDNHYDARPALTDRERVVLRAFVDVIEGNRDCALPPSNCPIAPDIQEYIPHAVQAVRELGGGSFPKGINVARDLVKDMKSILSIAKKIFIAGLIALFLSGIGIAVALIKLGIFTKLNQGGM